ncbi:hypothetical protein SISNIDRAFT_546952 [Sistotremastrum niveocremeum HHB9708]|uniref:Uncharacterized protein n=1 Tax=Sistotremastrum niveocremeum HHB9708 TaxID=1314777 RepID=A0A164ZPN8_9AGAM|nr:hypothetical protein SISNIDRAFT_546952 [Sistotremastrum niveocremeum HHB9708]
MKAFSQLLTSKKKRHGHQLPLQLPPEEYGSESDASPTPPLRAQRSVTMLRQTSDPLKYAMTQSAISGRLPHPHATTHDAHDFLAAERSQSNVHPMPRGRVRSHTIHSSQAPDVGSARLVPRAIEPPARDLSSPDFLSRYETPRRAPRPPRALEVRTSPEVDPVPTSPTASVPSHRRNETSSSFAELDELASFLDIDYEDTSDFDQIAQVLNRPARYPSDYPDPVHELPTPPASPRKASHRRTDATSNFDPIAIQTQNPHKKAVSYPSDSYPRSIRKATSHMSLLSTSTRSIPSARPPIVSKPLPSPPLSPTREEPVQPRASQRPSYTVPSPENSPVAQSPRGRLSGRGRSSTIHATSGPPQAAVNWGVAV